MTVFGRVSHLSARPRTCVLSLSHPSVGSRDWEQTGTSRDALARIHDLAALAGVWLKG